jgi:biopolymer transport protein ExbD
MGMAVNGGGSGSRRRRGNSTLSEINVTPFVDVVLVLLIIFMLTAHVMEFGVEVNVPEVKYVENTTLEMPIVTIDKTGEYTLTGDGHLTQININSLAAEIHTRFPAAKGVYVRADREAIWDPIAQVTAELGQGKLVVYMVTQPADTASKRR